MGNPILEAITGRNRTNSQPNNMLGLMSLLKNGNPNIIFNNMMQNNPKFAEFVNNNKGKSAEQIASENGIDMNTVRQFMK